MRLKYFLQHIDEREVTPETPLMSVSKIHGVVLRSEIANDEGRAEDIGNYKTCKPDDLVINRMAAYQGALGVAKQAGAISPDYMVLRIFQGFEPRFLSYFFKSHWMHSQMSSLVKGIGSIDSASARTPRLSWNDLKNLNVDVPPLDQQKAIADFLDGELSQIDRLVYLQHSLFSNLKEIRSTVISDAVLRGLRHAPTRDSGVPWIGKISSNWDVRPAKSVFALRNEASRENDEHLTPSQVYGVLPQVKYMEISGNRVVLKLGDTDNMKHVEPGDFVSHLRSFQGGLELSTYPGKVSGAYTVLKFREKQCPGYWRYLLKSDLYVQALQTTTDQLRDGQTIRMKELALVPLPMLTLDEQKEIEAYLDTRVALIDSITRVPLVEILKERRQALISAAVMGKIDVRKVA